MDKIHAVAFVYIFEDRAFRLILRKNQPVPADMGNLIAFRHHRFHGDDTARYQAEAFVISVFLSLVKQKLHAQAYAQQRLAGSGFFNHDFIKSGAAQLFCGVAQSAHPRKYYLIGFSQQGVVAGDDGVRTYFLKGAFQGKEISHPVIYDSYHQRTPFVEGIWPSRYGSIAAACLITRPKALKAPSMM